MAPLGSNGLKTFLHQYEGNNRNSNRKMIFCSQLHFQRSFNPLPPELFFSRFSGHNLR